MASILVKTNVAVAIDGDLKYKSLTPYNVRDTYENKVAADRLVADGLIDIVAPFTSVPPDEWKTMIQGIPEITVGEEVADAITVSVQLKDVAENNVAKPCLARVWLSDDVAGVLCAAAPSGGVTIGVKGAIVEELKADLHLVVASDNKGAFDLVITEVAAKTLYVNVEYQGYITSAKVEFAV